MYTVNESQGKYLVTKGFFVISTHNKQSEAQAAADKLNRNLALNLYQMGDEETAWQVASCDSMSELTKEEWLMMVERLLRYEQ